LIIDPAELQVDAFARGIGADQEPCAAVIDRPAEAFDLLVALRVMHAAVDLRDLPGVAHALKPLHEKTERVAMFSEDDQLLMRVGRVAEHFLQAFELRLRSLGVDFLGEIAEQCNLFPLGMEVGQ
jgi:hypothetical protein